MKIPFDIKYRPQIESGEYKAETRDGKPARIICWDMDSYNPIVALVANYPNYNGSLSEHIFSYSMDGRYSTTCSSDEDLFIVTPEEELTEFEKKVKEIADCKEDCSYLGNTIYKSIAAELLTLAREQFIKDGYIIEKKASHDAVENISDKHQTGMSVEYTLHCKVENGTRHAVMNWEAFQKVAQKFIDIGKAEALKDLPRWKKYPKGTEIDPLAVVRFSDGYIGRSKYASEDCYVLEVKDMLKLPGFKEGDND